MDNKEIRQANRKALPKFFLVMFLSLLVGGTAGYCSGRFRLDLLTDGIKGAGSFFASYIAPWLMVALALLLPAVCIPLYRSAKKLLRTWDGEDEDISDTIDQKLSAALWVASASLIFSYFLIAAAYSGGFAIFDNPERSFALLAAIAAFFAIMIEVVLIQQKCVDAAKQINPEKQASVYDVRFRKKWMEDCDEAEKLTIGKCAYKAYAVTNTLCSVLSIVLAVCALVFGIGFLPSLAVCLVWIVNLSVYCREAIRYSRAGNRIS